MTLAALAAPLRSSGGPEVRFVCNEQEQRLGSGCHHRVLLLIMRPCGKMQPLIAHRRNQADLYMQLLSHQIQWFWLEDRIGSLHRRRNDDYSDFRNKTFSKTILRRLKQQNDLQTHKWKKRPTIQKQTIRQNAANRSKT